MQLVVTPWRDASELLEVRRDFFGGDEDGRERAVSKVCVCSCDLFVSCDMESSSFLIV